MKKLKRCIYCLRMFNSFKVNVDMMMFYSGCLLCAACGITVLQPVVVTSIKETKRGSITYVRRLSNVFQAVLEDEHHQQNRISSPLCHKELDNTMLPLKGGNADDVE